MAFPALTQKNLKEIAALSDRTRRQESDLFLIEGIRMFREFINSGYTAAVIVIESGFENRHADVYQILQRKYSGITLTATEKQIRKLSDTDEPQGVVAVIRKPQPSAEAIFRGKKHGIILALDRIADPGNLGTIIRCADWFGVSDIALSKGCVDVYNPKVIRGTMGSVFRVRFHERADLSRLFAEAKASGAEIWGTSAAGPYTPMPSQNGEKNIILVIGSEAHGIADAILPFCDRLIRIPRYGHAESLNAAVACGILLYEMRRGHPTL